MIELLKTPLVLSSALVLFTATPAFADIINGDFSDGLNGWNAEKGNSYVTTGDTFAATGTPEQLSNPFAVIVPVFGDGDISQEFVTVPGLRYTLSFDYGALGGIEQSQTIRLPRSSDLRFRQPADPEYTAFVTNDLSSTFTRYSEEFLARSNRVRIRFQPVDSRSTVFAVLDNVSINVAAVPEPASWAMLLSGFGLVGFLQRRRARTAVVTA